MLATLVEKNGFFELQPEYSRNITHQVFQDTRVRRKGEVKEVSNYAGAGPFELWQIEVAIEGVAASIDWEKTYETGECPKW